MCFPASNQVCFCVEILSVCFKFYQAVIYKFPSQLGERNFDGPHGVCDLSSLGC